MNRDIRPIRRLIEAGRYEDARVLLHETHHPGVLVYLHRLEAAEQNRPVESDRSALWIAISAIVAALPVLLFYGLNLPMIAVALVIGILIGCVLTGLNARRKRCWVHPNLLPRSRSYRL